MPHNYHSYYSLLKDLVLFSGRDARSCICVYRDEFERDNGVPCISLSKEKNCADRDTDGCTSFQHGLSGVAAVTV